MATSKKIEEKYQKMLKEIQKRPENRHCFDCSGRGNQYVVLNYGVFEIKALETIKFSRNIFLCVFY
ncbi:hypothetical protein EMIHUDRAFT_223106 [Emiliania huxleyi CCMP1516]|uniref:Arf-GAP domain-containing protein n=2 Tax=Emiliania huxleyi TaxID=2903 RepID=A0A0D3KVY9_EMIH1|nr:hypothetical protein EMIHUDRAFT_223106 [Emiliania huxleyi CCMP1516]EOD39924.1 hypothetical protein EMIHUDRAFT_223106 [Emiliania huxleyi CCMP1516]|eukprot:XP_005792353.1 hypothetical protein EMIHUDRAFT_223106 [Emiliania huxleyi CCMP1516]